MEHIHSMKLVSATSSTSHGSPKIINNAALLDAGTPISLYKNKRNALRSVRCETPKTKKDLKHISSASAKQPALFRRRALFSIFMYFVVPMVKRVGCSRPSDIMMLIAEFSVTSSRWMEQARSAL